MQSPSSENSFPDQPSLAAGETLNAGVRLGGWFGAVAGALTILANLVVTLVFASRESSPAGGTSVAFGMGIVSGGLICGLGVWNLHRFPRIQIHETGLKIRDQLVPFAAITDVVKKERTYVSLRYVERGVTNEAYFGVSWMFGSDLAPVVVWLASRATAARAETQAAAPLADASRAG